jgi:imidazole glycerol phosphate synthase subunit HisF
MAASAAAEVEHLGAGEILLTSVERDGTMQGYDLDLIRAVSSAVSIPVIAAGGCGSYEHMKEAMRLAPMRSPLARCSSSKKRRRRARRAT